MDQQNIGIQNSPSFGGNENSAISDLKLLKFLIGIQSALNCKLIVNHQKYLESFSTLIVAYG